MRITPGRVSARVELKIDVVHTFMATTDETPFTAIGAYDDPREAVIDAVAFLEAATDAMSCRLAELEDAK